MREFENRVPEDIFNFVETELGEYADAMTDQRVARSVESARALEQKIALGVDVDLSQELRLLDLEVAHVMKQECELSGSVRLQREDGSASIYEEDVRELEATFLGYFIITPSDDEEEDDARIGYAFMTYKVGDEFLTRELRQRLREADPEGETTHAATQHVVVAPPERVSIDFKIASPERAMAWLNVMYPETLREIDSLVLGKEQGGRVVTLSDDEALHRLGGFRLTRPEDLTDEGWMQYKTAVVNYALSLCVVDEQVPYYAGVRGPVIFPKDEETIHQSDTATYAVEPSMLFGAQGLGFIDGERFAIGEEQEDDKGGLFLLLGSQLGGDIYDKERTIAVPLSSFTSLHSLRNVVL